ncbi:unnamed protein product [Prorocentrum cordatum]|uniref:Uncharacterized protein n=1 Tax=Prorocentrum cordatum TaxID=2364126 RepID=A0ABN9Q6V8_9DINO|nr:unnamed protein product [Polarella glacialis]
MAGVRHAGDHPSAASKRPHRDGRGALARRWYAALLCALPGLAEAPVAWAVRLAEAASAARVDAARQWCDERLEAILSSALAAVRAALARARELGACALARTARAVPRRLLERLAGTTWAEAPEVEQVPDLNLISGAARAGAVQHRRLRVRFPGGAGDAHGADREDPGGRARAHAQRPVERPLQAEVARLPRLPPAPGAPAVARALRGHARGEGRGGPRGLRPREEAGLRDGRHGGPRHLRGGPPVLRGQVHQRRRGAPGVHPAVGGCTASAAARPRCATRCGLARCRPTCRATPRARRRAACTWTACWRASRACSLASGSSCSGRCSRAVPSAGGTAAWRPWSATRTRDGVLATATVTFLHFPVQSRWRTLQVRLGGAQMQPCSFGGFTGGIRPTTEAEQKHWMNFFPRKAAVL